MNRTPVVVWAICAVAALTCLGMVLSWKSGAVRGRLATLWGGDARIGAKLFFQERSCGQCHSVDGEGGKLARDLGRNDTSDASPSQLVAAIWNCTPRMWELTLVSDLRYPALDPESVAHLFAFLSAPRVLRAPGDGSRGEDLLHSKRCTTCHGSGAAFLAPQLTRLAGVDSPLLWIQAMLNHASVMRSRMQAMGIPWPAINGTEMNDLVTYIGEVSQWPKQHAVDRYADPGRGWAVFRGRSCIVCHALNGEGGHVGPELGTRRKLPLTVADFGALMWSHSSSMFATDAIRPQLAQPRFEGKEMVDLVAFLGSLRFVEPTGSELIGRSRFSERQCSRCHGPEGDGSRSAPSLRGRGRSYSSVSLATELWRHGPMMYRRARQLGIRWPLLTEADVGNLISFLNAPIRGR